MMNDMERYRHLNEYLKEKFGERTLKICIDGGFTCPNRDGSIGYGGCIYCSERGSGELIVDGKNISELTEQKGPISLLPIFKILRILMIH